jgi:hypothetical protein
MNLFVVCSDSGKIYLLYLQQVSLARDRILSRRVLLMCSLDGHIRTPVNTFIPTYATSKPTFHH